MIDSILRLGDLTPIYFCEARLPLSDLTAWPSLILVCRPPSIKLQTTDAETVTARWAKLPLAHPRRAPTPHQHPFQQG